MFRIKEGQIKQFNLIVMSPLVFVVIVFAQTDEVNNPIEPTIEELNPSHALLDPHGGQASTGGDSILENYAGNKVNFRNIKR